MTYIDRLNAFDQWLESNTLMPNAQLLYIRLLMLFNRTGWPEQVQVDNLRLMSLTGIDCRTTLTRARDRLIEAGFIEFQKGKKGCPNKYRLKNAPVSAPVSAPINAPICAPVSAPENAPHNKTKTKSKNKPSISPLDRVNPIFTEYAGDDKELLSLLFDFEEMRNKIKAPMTDRARKALCYELRKLGRGSRKREMAILNKSILNNWKGVFPLKAEEEEEIADREKIFHAPDLP